MKVVRAMLLSVGMIAALVSAAPAEELPAAARPGPGDRPLNLELPPDLRFTAVDETAEPRVDAEGPLRLSLEEAVLLALRHNRSLRVEQLNPLITGTFEAIERAAFDPAVYAELQFSESERLQLSPATRETFPVGSNSTSAEVGVRQSLSTGTDVELGFGTDRQGSTRTPMDQQAAGFNLTVTQALLRGASRQANLVDLRQAELDTLASRYQLRAFAQTLVADVELAYWDYVLAGRRLSIFESSLELAERQLRETRQRIEAGALPETELSAVRAEAARRRQELISAQADFERLRLELLRLVNPPAAAGWARPVEPVGEPQLPPGALDPANDHVRLALRLRPELNEARLRLRQGRLEVIQTRNGLLPRLDFFITLGKTGYSDTFNDAFRNIDGDGYDLSAGLSFEYPLGNRGAEALHRGAQFQRDQALASLDNLAQLVALEVRQAHVEVERAAALIDATRATRELQEDALEIEQAKLRVGRSTGLMVAQAQRDLLAAQIDEVDAVVAYRAAITELFRLDGSLLIRHAIAAPGGDPVEG